MNKHPSPLSPTDFRSISITSIACKIMERCVEEKIDEFVNEHNIIPLQQFSFCNKLLLRTCSYRVHLTGIRNYQLAIVLISYISKFPRHLIQHRIASSFGSLNASVFGNILSWLKSFLTRRTSSVGVNSSHSNERSMISAVPQGSVLIGSASIQSVSFRPSCCSELYSNNLKMLMFADDIKCIQVME